MFRVQCRSIAEALTDEGDFTVLLKALDAAGLVTALTGPEVEVTVFAPTDAAFSELLETLGVSAEELLANKDLADILRVHVAFGQILSGTLASGAVVQSLEGARLSAHEDSTTYSVVVGVAQVVRANISAGKSVIHALDKVLLLPQRRLLDGGSAGWNENAWSVTVDGVMGGKSTGNVALEDGTMLFTGNINLDGGGFSSVRRDYTLDLSSYAGLLVEFDSHIFKANTAPLGIHLQLGSSSSSWDYSAPFAMPFSASSQERCKIFLPMEAFDHASSGGRTCSSCTLDPSNVDELSVYVLFQSGPFEVRLHSIQAVENAMDAPLPTAHEIAMKTSDIPQLIQATINSGAMLYDKGYRGLCLAIYATTMRQILAAKGPSIPLKDIACAGLRMTMEGTKAKKAWALRKALDALMADASGTQRKGDSHYPDYVRGSWLPAPGKSGTPGVCAGLADLSASGQNSTGMADHDGSASIMKSDTKPSSADKNVNHFLGPFEGWGISEWNDLGMHIVSHPSKCAQMCLQNNRCKSFDYGARGKVQGECWLSTADRTIAGAAYSRWSLYDYYERNSGTPTSSTPTSSDKAVRNQVRTVTSEPITVGTTTIKVQDVTGLSAGMSLVISDGSKSESKMIVSVSLGRRLLSKPRRLMAGTVTVDTALQFSFAAGADVTATGKANPAPANGGDDSDDGEKTVLYILVGGGLVVGLALGICASYAYLRVKSKRLEAAKAGNMANANNVVVGQSGGDFVIGQPVQGSAGGKGGEKVEK